MESPYGNFILGCDKKHPVPWKLSRDMSPQRRFTKPGKVETSSRKHLLRLFLMPLRFVSARSVCFSQLVMFLTRNAVVSIVRISDLVPLPSQRCPEQKTFLHANILIFRNCGISHNFPQIQFGGISLCEMTGNFGLGGGFESYLMGIVVNDTGQTSHLARRP